MSLMDLVSRVQITPRGRVVQLMMPDRPPAAPKRSRKKEPSNYRHRVDPELVVLARAIRLLGVEPGTNSRATGLSNTTIRNYTVNPHRHQDIRQPTDEDLLFAAKFVAEYVIARRKA